jgi:N-acetylneuraminate synthase
VKFQTHIAAEESTPAEAWRVQFSRQDATRWEYWKRMEFTEEQWGGLAAHAAERGLKFLSSAFSPAAVALLGRVGVPAWKVGAGEVTNLPMLQQMAETGKPVLLSSGMSGWADLDAAVEVVRGKRVDLAVLQCTTAYPCPAERIGLNVLGELRARYGCPAGLSDHSGTIYAGLAATALGARMIEVHVTLSRECFGPDVAASVTTAELAELVRGVRFIDTAMQHPVEKDRLAEEFAPLRAMFGKSVVSARPMEAGEVVRREDLMLKKPGTGLAPSKLEETVGRRLRRGVTADTVLTEEDFE